MALAWILKKGRVAFISPIEQQNTKLFEKIVSLVIDNKIVLVSLRNNKVYVGVLVDAEVDEVKENNFIEIIPLLSGIRLPDGTTKFTTRYTYRSGEIFRTSDNKEMRTTFLFSEVTQFSEFHYEIYEKQFKKKKSNK